MSNKRREKYITNIYFVFIYLTLLPSLIICQTKPKYAHNDPNWLNTYKVNDKTWVLASKRQNLTCYSGRVLYPYGPECADLELSKVFKQKFVFGDTINLKYKLSKDLTRSEVVHLGFNLTFMGHRFDKAWINQHGIISFQESFLGQTISQEDWPHPKYPYVDDPVFIAPLFAQTDLAGDKIEDLTSVKYGRVLYKVILRKDLPQTYTEEEKFIYQLTMKILDEGQKLIRESIASGERFIATHALIATWKSVAFLGNSLMDIDLRPRNTFQATILSNTNHTFVIFNYEEVQWYASTSQGGNPETGTGGKAAKIGFNRGNGTLWYGHRPFSENAQLMQSLARYSNVGVPGRYIYRIDEWIQPAGCLDIEFEQEKILHIWPRSGNMLGGQDVNITGPCFLTSPYFKCKWGDGFDAPITIGEATSVNFNFSTIRGRCVQPLLWFNGRLNLSISLDDGETYQWKAEYTIVDPLRYPARVEMVDIDQWHAQSSPPRLIVKWDRFLLSWAESDLVDIELWGYYEDDLGPHWDFLQVIGKQKLNKGSYGFDVAPNRSPNQTVARRYKVGAVAVSLFDSKYARHTSQFNMPVRIWTALHPLGWWRNDEMKFYYDKKSFLFGNSRGKNWAEDQCRWWHEYHRDDLYWMDELELCPPTVMFAIGDIGVWAPDPSCNMYGSQYNSLNCLQHPGASHCVITMKRTPSGSGNRCCYDKAGSLMYTNDTMSGSTPDRYHSLGMPPYNTYGKVPALSHYLHDIVPFYLCCHWSNLCESYLYLRQTKDARGYKEPRMAAAYGDPHLITFDGKDYTFNGKGEFTLYRSKKFDFKLQARFEQPPNATYCLLSSKGQVNATRITAITAGQYDSDLVEIRARVHPSQSYDLRCDVVVNGKTYYFNYTEEKVQIFKNVFIISPLHDTHQSNITIMFNSSGVGVNVECMYGLMHVRASAPYTMFKETSGLFGYWDNITANDFMSPDSSTNQLTLKPDLLYQRFGMAWRLRDESESIFSYTGSWTYDTFHDQRPMIKEWQRFRPWFTATEVPFPSNVTFTKEEFEEACEGDEQCLYDAAAMGSLDIGRKTRDAHRFFRVLHENMKSVNSCGIFLLKGGSRITTKGNYLSGSVMKLSCGRGYTLFGWDEFYCNWNATWLPTNNQWIEQFRDWPYCEHYHITAIRFTAIGISAIWLACLAAALIYYFFFKTQKDYEMKDDYSEYDEKSEHNIPFNDIGDELEMNALGQLENKNYKKDGFFPIGPTKSNRSLDNLTSETAKENNDFDQYQTQNDDQQEQINNYNQEDFNISNEYQPQQEQNSNNYNDYINELEERVLALRETNNANNVQTNNSINNNINNNNNRNNNNNNNTQRISMGFDLNNAQLLKQRQLEDPALVRMKNLKEQQQYQMRKVLQQQQHQQEQDFN